jgi:signal transduction histidine kinase
MKRKLTTLSRRYASALRKHLKQSPRASLESARGLGRQAMSLGLEAQDVAGIHEVALATLELNSSIGQIERANIFFTKTIKSFGTTHRAVLNSNTRLNRVNQTLDQRAVDLAASNRSLKKGISQRRTVAAALKKRVDHYKKLLAKSLPVQKHLQHLTHHILSQQEKNRKKISHGLQDEIAQTLLGINVRLLTVKRAAGLNDKDLQKEIASAQRLVEKSAQSINRFARELDSY